MLEHANPQRLRTASAKSKSSEGGGKLRKRLFWAKDAGKARGCRELLSGCERFHRKSKLPSLPGYVDAPKQQGKGYKANRRQRNARAPCRVRQRRYHDTEETYGA